jgi:hypothetical protein
MKAIKFPKAVTETKRTPMANVANRIALQTPLKKPPVRKRGDGRQRIGL